MTKSWILFVLALFAVSSSACTSDGEFISQFASKPVVPLSEIETLLTEGHYDEAKKKLLAIPMNLGHSVALQKQSLMTFVEYFEEADHARQVFSAAENDPDMYKADADYGVSTKRCRGHDCDSVSIKSLRLKFLRLGGSILLESGKSNQMSQEFIDYLNAYDRVTVMSFYKTNKMLATYHKEKEDRLAAEKRTDREKRDATQKAKTAARAAHTKAEHEERRRAQRARLQAALDEVDKLAKDAGYSAYGRRGIVELLVHTRERGGLQNYVGEVFGCPRSHSDSCRSDRRFRVTQVLDEGLLYSFSDLSGGDLQSFMIYVEKETGELYQNEQILGATFYVFTGVWSYPTVAGSTNDVPAFRVVRLED